MIATKYYYFLFITINLILELDFLSDSVLTNLEEL